MTIPNKALIHLFRANSAYVDSTRSRFYPQMIQNEANGGPYSIDIPMSAGPYTHIDQTGTAPSACANYHTQTSGLPVFNLDFAMWSPSYDIVILTALAGQPTLTAAAQGNFSTIKPYCPIYENSSGDAIQVLSSPETVGLIRFQIILPVESAGAGLVTQPCVFTPDSLGAGSTLTISGTGTATFLAATNLSQGVDWAVKAQAIAWFPWATNGTSTSATNPYWIALRFYKYVPGSNQYKIGVLNNLVSSGTVENTITIDATAAVTKGSRAETGQLICAPRCTAGYVAAQAHLVLADATAAQFGSDWKAACKEQGDIWIGLGSNNKDLTTYFQCATGPYQKASLPSLDYTYAANSTSPPAILGRLVAGCEIMLQVTNKALDCYPVDTGLQRVYFVDPFGKRVKQELRSWGYDGTKKTYLNNTNTVAATLSRISIGFVTNDGTNSITDFNGCSFVAINDTGAIEFIAHLTGGAASNNTIKSTALTATIRSKGATVNFP